MITDIVWAMGEDDLPWDGKDKKERRLCPKNWCEKGPLAEDATMEELADYCDGELEGANHHRYVGIHNVFCKMWTELLGRETAEKLMKQLAEKGGLLGLSN